jgi:HK97 gp10 family phage protein
MARGSKLLPAKEMIAAFARLSDVVAAQYVEKALQAGAEEIRDAEIAKTPVRSGRLRSQFSIQTVLVSRTRIVKTLNIGPDGFYWRFLELGTKWKKGSMAGRQKLAPHPWLRKAYKNRRPNATQTIRDTFREQVFGFEP